LQGRDGLVVVHDVTEQRRLEEENAELRRVELVGHLSASMAHDFNNLLTIISATSTLLAMETRGRDTEQELVNEIATACERASGLVRALLSRLRGGSAVAAPVDVNCAVRDLLPLVERLAGASVEVELDLDPHACEPFIVREAFEHALLNLVTNARDAMPEGGRLTIATRDMAMDADDSNSTTPHYVAVVVTDTGRGMSPFVRDRAFDRLFTTKGPGAGSGLGLASVRRFAVESRGCVSVHSAVGQGTSIRIYVPCCAPERAQRCEVTSSSPYEFPAFCVGC
jgi:signal transduction histidine kinase